MLVSNPVPGAVSLASVFAVGLALGPPSVEPNTTPSLPQLAKRQECPFEYVLCSAQQLGSSFSNICCRQDQACELDAANNPACCPLGAVCTGTVAPGNPTDVASFVSNDFFPFPYAPTSYPDQGACSTVSENCMQNYQACVTNLQGAPGFPVTIAVPGGGGTTKIGTQPQMEASSATSICSSLSSEGCSIFQTASCEQLSSASSNTLSRYSTVSVILLVILMNLAKASI